MTRHLCVFFFSSRRRHTRLQGDWSSDVCSSDLETEITYLASLTPAERRKSLETFFGFDLPCVVISKGQEPPAELLELARAKGVPVIRTKLKTAEFYRRLKPLDRKSVV